MNRELEILKFLEENKKDWFCSNDISEKTNIPWASVLTILRGLRTKNWVDFKKKYPYKFSIKFNYLYKHKKTGGCKNGTKKME